MKFHPDKCEVIKVGFENTAEYSEANGDTKLLLERSEHNSLVSSCRRQIDFAVRQEKFGG